MTAVSPVLAESFSVGLNVQETRGVARIAEPISGGVPLPKGLLANDQPFSLFRGDGTEIPCQVLPLVVETDGTLRWVLVDFQDNVAERAVNRYRLRATEAKVQPPVRLKITDDPRTVVVDTGRIALAVRSSAPAYC